MKTTLYTLIIIFFSLIGIASAKDIQTNKSQSYKMLDKQLIAKFHKELTFNFIKSKKPIIKSNLTSLLLMSDFVWSLSALQGDKYRDKAGNELLPHALLAKLQKKYRPQKINKCESLISAVNQKSYIVPIESKEVVKPAKSAMGMFNYFYEAASGFGKLKQYDVTLNQYSRVLSWQYAWNQPASCACIFDQNITPFCKKYGYDPISIPQK